jgi:hypothetical protein
VFKKTRARVADELRRRLEDRPIVALDDGANFFGVQSRGKAQIRGNGCLAATDAEILFLMWWPRREIRIARDRVTSIERARSHLGKSVGYELLRVHFTNDEGAPDSVAWWVADLPEWERVLQA